MASRPGERSAMDAMPLRRPVSPLRSISVKLTRHPVRIRTAHSAETRSVTGYRRMPASGSASTRSSYLAPASIRSQRHIQAYARSNSDRVYGSGAT